MTDFTELSNTAVGVGGLPSGATVTALRDNPVAISEGTTGAPVVKSSWHPYNAVKVGDGNTGKIYDFAIDGGVPSIATPNFVDGYEYRLLLIGLTLSSGTNNIPTLDFYKETDAAYQSVNISADWDSGGAGALMADIEFVLPRLSKTKHIAKVSIGETSSAALSDAVNQLTASIYDATVQKILRARVTMGGSTTNAGVAYLLKRLDGIT